mmetsp:Transcript_30056/g.71614  ORF Transcript_30056/g.71614 Transcript_30056/m.71614 type:complete len:212 (-) Transcript_30056:338-973(-)
MSAVTTGVPSACRIAWRACSVRPPPSAEAQRPLSREDAAAACCWGGPPGSGESRRLRAGSSPSVATRKICTSGGPEDDATTARSPRVQRMSGIGRPRGRAGTCRPQPRAPSPAPRCRETGDTRTIRAARCWAAAPAPWPLSTSHGGTPPPGSPAGALNRPRRSITAPGELRSPLGHRSCGPPRPAALGSSVASERGASAVPTTLEPAGGST